MKKPSPKKSLKASKSKPVGRKTAKSVSSPTKVSKYDHLKVEKKWQKKWADQKLYVSKESNKKKYYVLDMFPYPSGEGLHVGHPKGYIATDIISRYHRMKGYSVLHPMGFDAFGLPAENYALKTKTHPEEAVKKNVARYKKQLEIMGFDYDWSREVNTTDPNYYKWTQWIFLKLLEKGLAHESYEPINWCPVDKTGLANEDIENGRCERCGALVEKKLMKQWVLKITDYADRLLQDLDAIDDSGFQHLIDKKNPPRPGKRSVQRRTIHALVRDPKTGKFLGLKWKKHPWTTFIVGGVENGENVIEAAKREVIEETGYTDLKFVRVLGAPVKAEYFAAHKDENRVAITSGILFELVSDKKNRIAEDEYVAHEPVWLDQSEMTDEVMTCAELPIWLKRLKDEKNQRTNEELLKVKPLLDWPESIKELQRNWIGKSEGALIKFNLAGRDETVEVFTTRPDTIFGVTYVVLAPEHKLVKDLLGSVQNRAETEAYILRTQKETEIERTDATKEKTGVELKGIKVINPVNKEEVPVWIADYVLADYGTGAVMAVPAHDSRDWQFAKKYNLPIRQVVAPFFTETSGPDAPRSDKKTETRRNVLGIVKHWSEDKFISLNWKPMGWHSLVVGGADSGEDDVHAMKREIMEETGYKNLKFLRNVACEIHTHHFTPHKDQNRYGICQALYFELQNGDKDGVDEKETSKHDVVWVERENMAEYLNLPNNKYIWDIFTTGERSFDEKGILINSGPFNGKQSESVMKEITKFAGGQWIAKYKLRDWVFSRQRYWGEPIPVIHCEKCGIVAVPEKDLPLKLPKVKSYEPTGTGESPLAGISKWVNTKCPKCKGAAKRETNTMPQWAGSSWYYLRYEDPKNSKKLVDLKKEKYWSPVDLYVGGAEHATRHLIYARFWHKFLYDIGAVTTIEPFSKLQHVGLIMGEDGRKMSKRFGNVVNPDDIVKMFGADTLRIYEMFMGPFDQQIAWSTASMVGARRFVEKVWKLGEKVASGKKPVIEPSEKKKADKVIHKAIKKVTEDIQGLRFNTAISSLMIAVNELEKCSAISKEQFENVLKLLAPCAPHFTEDLWMTLLGNKKSIHISSWPEFDHELAKDTEVTIMIQVNGKVRGSFLCESGLENSELERQAKEVPEIRKWIEGKEIRKVIVVPNRLVNIVL